MSGEAAGGVVVAGGIVLAMPAMLALAAGGAALLAAAAAAEQVQKGIRRTEEYLQERKELKHCSSMMQRFNEKLLERTEKLDYENREFQRKVAAELESLKMREYEAAQNTGFDGIREFVIADGRKAVFSNILQEFGKAAANISAEYEKERKNQECVMGEYVSLSGRAADMEAGLAETEIKMKLTAQQMWQDAKGILKILQRENKEFGGIKQEQIQAVSKILDDIPKDYSAGLYEHMIISCRGVIEKGMLLANEIQTEGRRRELLRTQLAVQYEYLKTWLNSMRCVDREADEEYPHDIHEDLNDFSQGLIQKQADKIDGILNAIYGEESGRWTDIMWKEALNECWETMFPQTEKMITDAYGVLQNYLKKADVIDVLAEFMEEQGYMADWSIPRGEDLSQQLVTHFTNIASGSQISIILDVDSPAEEMSDIAVDILSYEEEENVNIELKREKIRSAMTDALGHRDIIVNVPLACKKDTAYNSSGRLEYNYPDKVAGMAPLFIFS